MFTEPVYLDPPQTFITFMITAFNDKVFDKYAAQILALASHFRLKLDLNIYYVQIAVFLLVFFLYLSSHTCDLIVCELPLPSLSFS